MSGYLREPKKVRTRPELEKSCRMLREHNEKLKAHNAELDGFITEYQKRELDFQDRIEVLECEIAMWRRHVVELEATIQRVIPGTPATESDWVKLVGEKEAMEATLQAIRELAGHWRQLQLKDKFECVIDGDRAADVLEALLGEAK